MRGWEGDVWAGMMLVWGLPKRQDFSEINHPGKNVYRIMEDIMI